MSLQDSSPAAATPAPPPRSRCGSAACLLALLTALPESAVLLLAGGTLLFAREFPGYAQRPLLARWVPAVVLLLAAGFALLWLTGAALATIGLLRTGGRCGWSTFAGLAHLVLLVGGIAGAELIGSYFY